MDNFPKDYEYLLKEKKEYETTVRVKGVTCKAALLEWMKKYGECSLQTWKVSKSFSAGGKVNIYKCAWRCHRNVHCKIANGNRTSKNTNCPATLSTVIKRYVSNSRSQDPAYHLNELWPCEIRLNHKHNHDLESAASLKHRPMSEETKSKLIKLFNEGYTASSAVESLKWDLYLTRDDYEVLAADGAYVPSVSKSQHLLNSIFSQESLHKDSNSDKMLRDLVEVYNKEHSNGKAIFNTVNSNRYVVLCSPIMARVHCLIQESGELVILDSAGGMNKAYGKAYVLLTPTLAGSFPLGVIISETESAEMFSAALLDLKKCFPDKAFYGNGYPQVFVTNGYLQNKFPLQEIFPLSSLLLCQFHVLKDVWNWLLTAKHGVPKNERHNLYPLFKNMMYASSEEELNTLHESMSNLPQNCYNFVEYITKEMWPKIKSWATVHRQYLRIRDNTDDYVEITRRTMEENILKKIRTFNTVQMFDFVSEKYEKYLEKRCVDYADGKLTKSFFKKHVEVTEEIDAEILSVGNDVYLVYAEQCTEPFMVDRRMKMCTCESRHLCGHLSTVLKGFGEETTVHEGSTDMRTILYKVGTGKDAVNPSHWVAKFVLIPGIAEYQETDTIHTVCGSRINM